MITITKTIIKSEHAGLHFIPTDEAVISGYYCQRGFLVDEKDDWISGG